VRHAKAQATIAERANPEGLLARDKNAGPDLPSSSARPDAQGSTHAAPDGANGGMAAMLRRSKASFTLRSQIQMRRPCRSAKDIYLQCDERRPGCAARAL